ncbi:anaerobic ribonucleoside-triphosphate reductase activating protein [Butyrivibrio sp. JL13D10]|uniref:anaerobic ribonucleoside-triphosphate reductase activating protein n=1 Tax=Butyrivibrio sp. JL13D10 TaxID=3236815 RepID=UPI0038B44E45
MKIHGLQKMTLLDYPSKVAATVFLGGCDFSCPYCHNYEIVDGSAAPIMDEAELFSFLAKRKGLLDGVAITGGEPCLHKELPDFISRIKEMGFLIKLDTNGYHPEMVEKLLSDRLIDYIAMDIKNSPAKYQITSGLTSIDLSIISRSISLIMNSEIPYEFRTTTIAEFHNNDDFEEISKWIAGAKAYYLQQFTPRDTVPDKSLTPPSKEDMLRYLKTVKKHVSNAELRGL